MSHCVFFMTAHVCWNMLLGTATFL